MTADGEESRLTMAATRAAENVNLVRVRVVDIEMSFGSMVVFMVKGALAAIPALLILGILGFFCAGFLAALVSSSH